MINFVHKPVNEVLVGDLLQESIENFLHVCKIQMVPNAIWVDGIIILIAPTPRTDKMVDKYLEGKRMYDLVVFVKYPKYTETVKHNGGTFEFPLRNYKNYTRFKELAKWIKSQPEWDTIPEGLA